MPYDVVVMPVASPAYVEIIDFIAAGTTPENVANYQPSVEAQERFASLLEMRQERSLLEDEAAELDHFIDLEHILRMAKAKARQIVFRGK